MSLGEEERPLSLCPAMPEEGLEPPTRGLSHHGTNSGEEAGTLGFRQRSLLLGEI